MCGIAGLVHINGKSVCAETLSAMTTQLSHRGPDGSDFWIKRNAGLGHTRLAIIDLSDSGTQPMHSKCERFSITYNGEIYNFKN